MLAVLLSSDILDILNLKLFNGHDVAELIIKFAFNTLILFILIRLLYYVKSRRRDYMLAFFMIGTIVFLLCFILENVKLQTGMALGLFAIFGILRYRTIQISIKEMTYLFLVIGISVINALASKKTSLSALLLTNFLVLIVAWIVERVLYRRPVQMLVIRYEKIELVTPGRRKELIEDLEARTGLKIHRIEIDRVNFLRDTVDISVFYFDNKGGGES